VAERKRRTIPPRTRLRIFLRDGLRCTICGATPALDPGVALEVEHHVPFSRGGTDDDDNYRTLCRSCNRGKGNDESLNKDPDADLVALLYRINPAVLEALAAKGEATVIANAEDYVALARLNRALAGYEITPSAAVIMGLGARAGPSDAIYTIDDSAGAKTLFRLATRE
jgi:hypothetical protein